MVSKLEEALGTQCYALATGIITKDGVLFTPTEVQQMTGESLRAMYASRAQRTRYDFDWACKTGKLRVYAPTPNKRPAPEGQRPTIAGRLQSVFARRSPKAAPSATHTASWVITLVKIVMGGIGIVSAGLSMYYLHDFLSRSNTPFVARVLSVTMVLAVLCCCELAIFFWQRKQYPLAVAFAIFWLLPICFTIFATVDANFYQYMAQDSKREQVADTKESGDRALALLQEATRQASDAVVRKEADIATYKATEKPSLWKVEQMEKELVALRQGYTNCANAEIAYSEKKDKQQTAVSAKSVADRPSSFEFIAAKLHWDAKLLQLIMSLVPALFNEFMAPIALAVAMFLQQDKKENVCLNR